MVQSCCQSIALVSAYSFVVVCALDDCIDTGFGFSVDGSTVRGLGRAVPWDCTAHLMPYLQFLHKWLLKFPADMPVVVQPMESTAPLEVRIDHKLAQKKQAQNGTLHQVPTVPLPIPLFFRPTHSTDGKGKRHAVVVCEMISCSDCRGAPPKCLPPARLDAAPCCPQSLLRFNAPHQWLVDAAGDAWHSGVGHSYGPREVHELQSPRPRQHVRELVGCKPREMVLPRS